MELFKGMKSGSDVGVVVWSLTLFVILCRIDFVCSGLSYISEFSFVWDLWHCLLVQGSWDCIIGKLVRVNVSLEVFQSVGKSGRNVRALVGGGESFVLADTIFWPLLCLW